jgi:pimeloyl-ACP methyl ester carboxylesterase
MHHLSRLITRPTRDIYTTDDLGPKRFMLGEKIFRRKDMDVINNRGHILKGSWFVPEENFLLTDCMIYCHGNSGSRMDSLDVVEHLLPHGISVFAFDFAGSGLSEGSTVSLGYHEKDDIVSVVEMLRNIPKIQKIGLWGRSMGASSILRYACHDNDIFCLVVDSAFSSLNVLCVQIAKKFKLLPEQFINYVI